MSSVRTLARDVPFVWDVRNWRDDSSHPFFPMLHALCSDIIECAQDTADSAACAHFDATISILVSSSLEPARQADFHAAWPETKAMVQAMHAQDVETSFLIIGIVSGAALLVSLLTVGLVAYVIVKLRRL